MMPRDRALARRQLDNKLASLREQEIFARPRRGWIKSIREALGMTATQLGQRLGVSQPRVTTIEKAEVEGALTLESLERAAHALDCRLVYALVPREPLNEMLRKRAERKARAMMAATGHSMALEAQAIDKEAEAEQFEELVRRLLDKAGAEMWNDPL